MDRRVLLSRGPRIVWRRSKSRVATSKSRGGSAPSRSSDPRRSSGGESKQAKAKRPSGAYCADASRSEQRAQRHPSVWLDPAVDSWPVWAGVQSVQLSATTASELDWASSIGKAGGVSACASCAKHSAAVIQPRCRGIGNPLPLWMAWTGTLSSSSSAEREVLRFRLHGQSIDRADCE